MKKLIRILAITLCIVVVICSCLTATATEWYKTTTDSYSCKVHSNCAYITFYSHGNDSNGAIYDKYFSANHSHWPNAFRYDKVWSYKVGNTGYAKGTYTLYSSLVTQWASIAFASTSDTITHVY